MPRSAKCRRVCQMPAHCRFAPEQPAHGDAVVLTVEEYEAVRLMDYLGLNQEEAAARMDVARTTVQRIYAQARRKLAVFLVEGRALQIGGGSYAPLAGDYYVLNCTRYTSVIVECGFLSNPQEEALLCTEAYRRSLARAVFYGALAFFA